MREVPEEIAYPYDVQPWSPGRVAVGVILVVLAVVAALDAWVDIARIAWYDEEASQVLLVPAVVVWLLVAYRHELRRCRPANSLLGPAVIVLGWIILGIGYNNAIQSFWHGGAVLVAVGAVLSVTGWDVLKRFWPVFLVLVFLVPVPGTIRQQIAMPLQTATATATRFVFDLAAVDVAQSGNVLHYRGVEVAVAEACNGMRMVFVLLLVCFAVVFASPLRYSVRIGILLVSPVVAVLCNVIRLVPTVWVYGHFSDTVAGQFHDWSGWAMVVVAFLMAMGLIRLLQWIDLPVMQPRLVPAMSAAASPAPASRTAYS